MKPNMDIAAETLHEVLQRHRAFWRREPAERPLVGFLPVKTWAARPYPLQGGRFAEHPCCVTPDDMDVTALAGSDQPLPSLLLGDLINTVGCRYPEAWMEAVIGCPIYVSSFGCVARPAVGNIDEALARFSLDEALHSPWLPVMRSVLQAVRALAGETHPAGHLHLRGIVDMLAAYLGEETLCLALCDEPEKVEQLAEQFAHLFLAVVEQMQPITGTWQEGVVSAWQVYAPQTLLDYQIDASSLLSPAVYAKHLLPYDRTILARFPHTVLHLHACGLHMVDILLPCEEVTAIEINSDREAGAWRPTTFTPLCRKIQQHGKPLVIFSEFSAQEYQQLTDALDPAGLAIYYWGTVG